MSGWASGRVSEWMSGWASGRVSEWVGERVGERVDEWVNEWVSEWTSEWVSEWMSGWASGRVSEWMSGWVSERVDEWVSEQVSGWTSERVTPSEWASEWVSDWCRHLLLPQQSSCPSSVSSMEQSIPQVMRFGWNLSGIITSWGQLYDSWLPSPSLPAGTSQSSLAGKYTISFYPTEEWVIFLSYVYSKQPILGLTQEWFRELSFSRLECGVHNKLHISSADW